MTETLECEIVGVIKVEPVQKYDWMGDATYVKVELVTKTISGERYTLERYFTTDMWKISKERGFFRA